MIILNELINQENLGFSYTNSNSIVSIEVFSNVNDVVVFYHTDSNIQINIKSLENSSIEFVEIFDKDNENNESKTNIEVRGIFNHIILNKSSIDKYSDENRVDVYNNGNYRLIYLDFNNGSNHIENIVNLNNDHNEGQIYLASVVDKNYVKKIFNTINNNSTNTNGYMSNYGVSFDTGKLVIKGVGSIIKGASKSKSNQKSTMYVMDETSSSTSEPILYIDEDDVEASHASAVGEIDENTIFYLCSRGLKKSVARKLIVLGEFKTLVNLIKSLEIKNLISNYLSEVINNV